MRLTTIPNLYRNVNRLTEILSVLSKYGLADWISSLNVDFAKGFLKDPDGEALARHTRESRIRIALTELGPTFIKLGQILSSRPDLVGTGLADELRKLQQEVPADPADVARKTLEDELGQPIEDLFEEFDEEPIASASIGQVHRARLKTGQTVAVKIQHADIQETVRKDLDVLATLAQMVQRLPEFAPYRPVDTVAEFQRTLRRELDFGREERNLQYFNNRFANNPYVRVPAVYSELSTPRALTMEFMEGVKLTERERLAKLGCDREEIARRGAELCLEMVFVDGYYHADPHPGNILLLPGNVIALMDFGMVGRIEERLREDIEEMLLAMTGRDAFHLTSILIRIGDTPPDLNEKTLRSDVGDFVTMYGSQSLDQFDLSAALTELAEILFRHRIKLPPQVAMLLKMLITLEGTSKLLAPSFSLMEVMQPFRRKILRQRLSPARRLRKMRRIYVEIEQLVEILPRRVMDILEQVQTGKFDVHLQHRGLMPSINRLVVGMLSSSLFMGSSLMLSRQVPPVLFPQKTIFGLHNVSVLGLSGVLFSLFLGLWLLRAINKSGHLDRRD